MSEVPLAFVQVKLPTPRNQRVVNRHIGREKSKDLVTYEYVVNGSKTRANRRIWWDLYSPESLVPLFGVV